MIELMSKADLDEVLAIENASFSHPWNRQYFIKEIENSDISELYVLKENGEIESCDIEIDLYEDQKGLEWLKGLLNNIGIPKGSVIQGVEPPINVGTLEGLAIYLNGTDLPQEVYSSCDVNYVIDQLQQAVHSIGSMYSYR